MIDQMQSKMKKGILLIFTVALLSGLTVRKATAQASINAKVNAEVILALTATETAELNFGRFSPETTGGEVKVSPAGVRSAKGKVALSGGTHNSASFYITGQYEATVTITLPSAPAILRNSVTAKTMEVSDWESDPPAGLASGKLDKGELAVNVGASLKVGTMTENPVGIYAGTYSITFSYN